MLYVTPVGLAALACVIVLAVALIYLTVRYRREQQRTRREIADLTARIAAREASDQTAQQAWDEAMTRMYGRQARRHRARSHLTGLAVVPPFRCRDVAHDQGASGAGRTRRGGGGADPGRGVVSRPAVDTEP